MELLEWLTLKHIIGVILLWFIFTPVLGALFNIDNWSAGYLEDFKVGLKVELVLTVIVSGVLLIVWLLR